jgi:hypothetical protein
MNKEKNFKYNSEKKGTKLLRILKAEILEGGISSVEFIEHSN